MGPVLGTGTHPCAACVSFTFAVIKHKIIAVFRMLQTFRPLRSLSPTIIPLPLCSGWEGGCNSLSGFPPSAWHSAPFQGLDPGSSCPPSPCPAAGLELWLCGSLKGQNTRGGGETSFGQSSANSKRHFKLITTVIKTQLSQNSLF